MLFWLVSVISWPLHNSFNSLCKKSDRKFSYDEPSVLQFHTALQCVGLNRGRCIWGIPGAQSKHLSVSPLHRLSEHVNDRSMFNTLVIGHICLDFRPWCTTVTDRHYHHQSEKLSSANITCIKGAWIINNWIILYRAKYSPLFISPPHNVLECGIWSNLLWAWKRQKVHTR